MPMLQKLRKCTGLLVLVLAIAGCETVPVDGEAVRANTIIVLPADTLHKELARHSGDVQQRIADVLRKRGFTVTLLGHEEYSAMHAEALTVSGSMYEPSVGRPMALNPNTYTKALIDLSREKHRFDVMVIPELVLRKADTVGDEAVWDGVEIEFGWVEKPSATYTLPRKASGLSLRMSAYTDSGHKVFINYAGLSLPYDLVYDDGKFMFELKEQFFTDRELDDSIRLSMKTFNQMVTRDD